GVVVDGGRVVVHVRPGTDRPETLEQLRAAIEAALRRLPGVTQVAIHFARAEAGRGRDPFAARAALPGVAHVVAVASTKGGVGKSTVAANLPVALAAGGRRPRSPADAHPSPPL